MNLTFKDPTKQNLRKVMIYGHDGTGKSTFAADYCCKHNLNPVVIDVDDTNRTRLFTEGKVLDLNFDSDVKAFNELIEVTRELKKHPEIDTIIIDGVTSMLDLLVSNSKGMAKYSDRALRFTKVLQALLSCKKHLIFVGQIDMEVHYTDKFQSSRAVIKVNGMVNEKYLCEAEIDEEDWNKSKFWHTQVKNRTMDEILEEQFNDPIVTPTKNEKIVENSDDPIKNQCIQIKGMLEKEGKKVNKSTMKSKVIRLCNDGTIPSENRPQLIKFIQEKCPEELE